jgi:3-hydroxyacyl-CoA dehydrogenase/enoyl-CoA hydratase/3-hydroxybutyryl-CoA epimerase
VALCERFAGRHGDRFKPAALLVEMAKKGETFYSRFAPEKKRAA